MYYCRQRPTLPHSCPCSTIGGIRLNFRVRNGNGCDPDPMTTGMLAAWGSPLRSLRELRGARPRQSCQRTRDFRLQSSELRFSDSVDPGRLVRQSELCSEICNLVLPRQLNILQTVVSSSTSSTEAHEGGGGRHAAVSACIVETIYGQASRLISIGQLNASPRLHTRPITWSSSRSL